MTSSPKPTTSTAKASSHAYPVPRAPYVQRQLYQQFQKEDLDQQKQSEQQISKISASND